MDSDCLKKHYDSKICNSGLVKDATKSAKTRVEFIISKCSNVKANTFMMKREWFVILRNRYVGAHIWSWWHIMWALRIFGWLWNVSTTVSKIIKMYLPGKYIHPLFDDSQFDFVLGRGSNMAISFIRDVI